MISFMHIQRKVMQMCLLSIPYLEQTLYHKVPGEADDELCQEFLATISSLYVAVFFIQANCMRCPWLVVAECTEHS